MQIYVGLTKLKLIFSGRDGWFLKLCQSYNIFHFSRKILGPTYQI